MLGSPLEAVYPHPFSSQRVMCSTEMAMGYSEVCLPEAIPRQWKGPVELDSLAPLPEESLLAHTADFLCLLHMLFLYLLCALQVNFLFPPLTCSSLVLLSWKSRCANHVAAPYQKQVDRCVHRQTGI